MGKREIWEHTADDTLPCGPTPKRARRIPRTVAHYSLALGMRLAHHAPFFLPSPDREPGVPAWHTLTRTDNPAVFRRILDNPEGPSSRGEQRTEKCVLVTRTPDLRRRGGTRTGRRGDHRFGDGTGYLPPLIAVLHRPDPRAPARARACARSREHCTLKMPKSGCVSWVLGNTSGPRKEH